MSSKMKSVDSCQDDVLVSELRSALSDMIEESPLLSEYFYLHLWLKSRNMKVKEAEKAIRNSWKWRQENDLLNVEQVHAGMDAEFFEFLPGDATGRDKNGTPVLQMSIGEYRTNACIDQFGRDGFLRLWSRGCTRVERLALEYHQYLCEIQHLGDEEQGALKSKGITAILNFANFSFKNSVSVAAIKVGLEATRIFGNYFCGHVDKIIFINVNSVASHFLKPLLPLLSGVPVEIYDTDSSVWMPKLYSWVDPSQLLPSYGGTKRAEKPEEIFNFYAAHRKYELVGNAQEKSYSVSEHKLY